MAQDSVRIPLNELQQEHYSLDTNRIYHQGVSEVQEPNWGLRNRISGWSQRIQDIYRPQYQRVPLEEHLSHAESVEIPIEEETSFSVSIPEAAETTSLLTGSTSISASTAGITGAGAVGTQIAVGAGITTGAIVGGGIIAYAANKLSNSGATLPHHSYIGPGNPIDKNPGVDVDDNIAKEHDIAYQNAKTSSDVKEADRIAINKFNKDFEESGNYHSKLGAIGLQLKSAIEHKFGVIYPSVSGTYHYLICLKHLLLN
uniref:Structural protein n=1 Tax=Periparus ater ambidensovirus TaxID=2794455 RepID=A0A8A4XDN3_9VIRU|nr:MAG: structural protein [Periparus ater ambidensovirus]